jgi:hypothetical protein
MVDRDLAALYGTTTMAFNQAVKRNLDRFPPDFRFELTDDEYQAFKPELAAAKRNLRYAPSVFTEHGVAMLSGVLRSPRAIQVNIAIMRAFNRLREAAAYHSEFRRRLETLEAQYGDLTRQYDGQFSRVFDALRELMRAVPAPAPISDHSEPLLSSSSSEHDNS